MPQDLQDWTSAQGAPQRTLGTFTAGPNATTSQTFTISPGTHSVAVLLNSLANVNSVAIVGVTSGVIYASNLINNNLFGTLYFQPVLSTLDSQVSIQCTMGVAAQSATLRCAEILDPEIVAIYQSNVLTIQGTGIGSSVNADVTDRFGRQVGETKIRDWAGGALGPSIIAEPSGNHTIAVAQADPRTWQAALATPIGASVNLNAGAAVTILGGVAGQTARVFGVMLCGGASTNVDLEDTAGVQFCNIVNNASVVGTWDGHGGPLAVGTGIAYRNNSGANQNQSYAVSLSRA